MRIKTTILTLLVTLAFPLLSLAQSFEAVLSANVQREVVNGKVFYESSGSDVGKYESVNVFIIDNTPVIRFEEGLTNEHGFVDEDKMESIMFGLTNLKSYFSGNSWELYGNASNKGLNNGKPFEFRMYFSENGSMTVEIGNNMKYCNNVRNYNMSLLDNYSQKVSSSPSANRKAQGTPSTGASQNSKKKTTKPPLRK